MQPNQVPVSQAFIEAFSRHPIYDTMFSCMSPASLIRLGRTCKLTFDAMKDYHYRAWDINRSLSHFVSDPISFRSLQARTETVISGSFALQFFDRTFYPEADLDLYVDKAHALELGRYLIKDGYTFVSKLSRSKNFETAVERLPSMRRLNISDPDHDDPFSDDSSDDDSGYGTSSTTKVYSFTRPLAFYDENIPPLKVQIVAPAGPVFGCVLSFHTTCVMNLITHNMAYALYPLATFEGREAAIINANSTQDSALDKYQSRGWSLTGSHRLNSKLPVSYFFYLGVTRCVTDGKSWTIALDTDGAHGSPLMWLCPKPLTNESVAKDRWILTSRLYHHLLYHGTFTTEHL